MDARPTAMGPPPTSHFHILADTPAGLAPVNPPKTPQPSAARTMLDLEGKTRLVGGKTEEGAEGKTVGPDFGLKTDIYDKRNAALKRFEILSSVFSTLFIFTIQGQCSNSKQGLDSAGNSAPVGGS